MSATLLANGDIINVARDAGPPASRPLADVAVVDLRRNVLGIAACGLRVEMPGIRVSSGDPRGERDILLESALALLAGCVGHARINGEIVDVARRIGEVLAHVGLPADDLQAFGGDR
ncbi:MAG: hypothetical protein ACK52I_01725 [Pseudomonadota bacterium]|jgi:hypothetical protein